MKILPKRGDQIKLSQISDLFWHTPTETVTDIVVVKKELTKTITVDDYPEMDSPIPSAQTTVQTITWNRLKKAIVSTSVVESITDLTGVYSNQTLDGKRIYCEFKPTEVKAPIDYFPSSLVLNINKDIVATKLISNNATTNAQIVLTEASKVKNRTVLPNPSAIYGTSVAVFGGTTEMIGAPVNRTITTGVKFNLSKVKTVEYQVNRSNGSDWGSNPPDAAHGAGNENLYFEYSIDGKTWVILDTLAYNVTPASVWLTRSITLPAQARWKDGVFLRFRQPTTDGTNRTTLSSSRRDMWAVTSVRITDTDYGVIIDNDYAGAIGVTVNGKWVTYFDNGKIGLLTAPPEPTPLTLYKNGLVWNAGDTIGIVVDDEKKLLFFYRNNVLQYTHQYTANQNNQLKIFMVQGPGRSLSGGVNFGKDPFTYKEHFSALHKLTDHPFGSIQTTTTWTTENVPVTSVRDLTQFNAYKFNLSSFYGVVDDIPHKGIIKLSDFNSKYEPKFHITTFPAAGQYTYNIPPGCTNLEAIIIGAGGGGGAGGITWQSPMSPFLKYKQFSEWDDLMKWYPNLAGGGGGGAGEVLDKINLKTYNADTATITIGVGGKGGVAPRKNEVFTKWQANGQTGGNTVVQIGSFPTTAKGGYGGAFPGSWEYDYSYYISPTFDYNVRVSGLTYNDYIKTKADELTAGGLPGGSKTLSGSGQSGSSFRSYSMDSNFVWSWTNFNDNVTKVTNTNNGTTAFLNGNQFSRLIGRGGSGGGNKYFVGGQSGITSKLIKDWMYDVLGVNIVSGLITEIARKGQNGAGGAGGHGAGGHIDRKTWWWDSNDIFYDSKQANSYLDGRDYNYSSISYKNSTSYTIPRGAQLKITAYGAGGSGGDGSNVNGDPHGGKAGQKVTGTYTANSGDVISVNIGTGGAGVKYRSGRTGTSGGNTTVSINGSVKATALGGAGGARENGTGHGESSEIGIGGTYIRGSNGMAGGLAAGGAGVDFAGSAYQSNYLWYSGGGTNGAWSWLLNNYSIWNGDGNYYWDIYVSQAGTHTFYTSIDNTGALWVDGNYVVETTGGEGSRYGNVYSGSISLSVGWHRVQVWASNWGGPAAIGWLCYNPSGSAIYSSRSPYNERAVNDYYGALGYSIIPGYTVTHGEYGYYNPGDMIYSYLSGYGAGGCGPAIGFGTLSTNSYGSIGFGNGLIPLLRNMKPYNSAAPSQDIIFRGANVTQAQLTAMGIQTGVNSIPVVTANDVVRVRSWGYADHNFDIGYYVWNAGSAPSSGIAAYVVQDTHGAGGRQYFDYIRDVGVPSWFNDNSVLVFGVGDRWSGCPTGMHAVNFQAVRWTNPRTSGRGGNGFVKIETTEPPVSISAGNYEKSSGNIAFNIGIFPVLRNFKPTNCSYPTTDLIFIGETVTQSKLVDIGIKTSIDKLFVVKAGDKLNWKVTGQASGDLRVGWWKWENGNPVTTGVNYLVRDTISSDSLFRSFERSGTIIVPESFMADDVIVFGLGDNNTYALKGVSFTVGADIAKLNLKEFQNGNEETAQSGASGGDGYVKVTAWEYNSAVDANFVVPIGVSTLKFIVGTQSVTVSGLVANEFIFIKRSGISGEHSYVSRDISDDIEGGVVVLVTGNTTGGMENVRIETV